MDSSGKILAKRYARAYMGLDGKVFGTALEKASHEKLEGLRRVFEAARPYLKTLTHPVVNSSVRIEALRKVLGDKHAGSAADFTELLVKRGRFNLLEEIMQECLRLHDDFCGLLRAQVFSRYPLSPGEMQRIEAMLAAVSGRKVSARNITTERVLGGFEIKVGDTVIDATVRGRLEAMKAELARR
ncbi:MAG: ATP synthase F1 subunit delta [Elusimicrobia bacterium GWA2_62_23]|nr:MAG: ATP synthase F1 subunit delta [Elusimicrobia bacterium GWA2_62_23]OGR72561.1 MAG: ATP synthase F1 subunit delta [Elusimicrobia bacterium GWC2_63_65]